MMMSIVKWPDPILMAPCPPWDFNDPPAQVDFLMSEMIETMAKSGGIGLAANQVGVAARMLVMHVQETNEYRSLFNPEIVQISESQYVANEGCLSFPGILLNISRPTEVTVKYVDHLQTPHVITFKEMDAKCFLHELDHLDGKTFREYVSELKYNMALKKAKKWGYHD